MTSRKKNPHQVRKVENCNENVADLTHALKQRTSELYSTFSDSDSSAVVIIFPRCFCVRTSYDCEEGKIIIYNNTYFKRPKKQKQKLTEYPFISKTSPCAVKYIPVDRRDFYSAQPVCCGHWYIKNTRKKHGSDNLKEQKV